MGMGVEVGNGMRGKAGRLAGNKGVKLSVKGCHKGVSKAGLECGGGGCWQSGWKTELEEERPREEEANEWSYYGFDGDWIFLQDI